MAARAKSTGTQKGSARRYSRTAAKKVGKAIHEYKRGTLKGGAGRHPRVKSRKQAIAIGLNEARKAGAKVPAPPRRRAKKKRASNGAADY